MDKGTYAGNHYIMRTKLYLLIDHLFTIEGIAGVLQHFFVIISTSNYRSNDVLTISFFIAVS